MASRSHVFPSCTSSHPSPCLISQLSTERPKPTFKKTLTESDGRRSRQETSVQLRKSKKEEQMKKKRQIAGANGLKVSSTIEELKEDSNVSVSQPTITRIAELMQVLHQFFDDPGSVPVEPDLLGAVKDLRRLLSVERNPPVDLIIDAGALPYFVAFLTNNEYPMLQFEAAWALTNIASTSRTKDVANCDNAVRSLVKLLYSPSANVREQAIWCIGNIAGESVAFRDGILCESGLIEGM
jgi:importin subunit alpha-1